MQFPGGQVQGQGQGHGQRGRGPHSHPQLMEEEEEPSNLFLSVLNGVSLLGGLTFTGLKYGWIPFVFLMGATSVYCGPSFDIASIFPSASPDAPPSVGPSPTAGRM